MRYTRHLSSIMLAAIIFFGAAGCLSTKVRISGEYGGGTNAAYLCFKPNGELYYTFAPHRPQDGLPWNMGHYTFQTTEERAPHLSLRSAHAGMFQVRFSRTFDRLWVKHAELFTNEIELPRLP